MQSGDPMWRRMAPHRAGIDAAPPNIISQKYGINNSLPKKLKENDFRCLAV
jgi:hypothetical protein